MKYVQVTVAVPSRDALHGALKRAKGVLHQKHLPSFFTYGVGILNLEEDQVSALEKDLMVLSINEIRQYNQGDEVEVASVFCLDRKVKGDDGRKHRQVIQSAEAMPIFKKLAGLRPSDEKDHKQVAASAGPLVAPRFINHNTFSVGLLAIVEDAETFNRALIHGVGHHGSYGYGLLRVK